MDIESSRLRLDFLQKGNLNDISKQCIETSLIVQPLKPHQRTMLAAMIELESGKLPLNYQSTIHTSIGICADITASGKSLEILACIAANPVLKPKEKVQLQFGTLVHLSSTHMPEICTHLNLIVVPHSCVQQWNTYIQTFTKLNHITITRRNQIQAFKLESVPETVHIVLVSNTMYNDFSETINCVWSRVIYDEADTVAIPNTLSPQANFIWFVTSSLQNLLFPSGTYFVRSQLPESNRTIITRKYIEGIRRNGFIKETFRMLERPEANNVLTYIVLKNENNYVKESFKLPAPVVNIIRCRTPVYVRVLNGFITNEIMSMLNAGNILGAIEKTGVNMDTCENIVSSVTQSYETQLHNTKLQYECVQHMEYARQADKDRRLQSLQDEINKLTTTINSIKERIENYQTSACPICIDTPRTPITTSCCNNVFCFECITRSLEKKNTCPMCRTCIGSQHIVAISNNAKPVPQNVCTLPSKDDAFTELLQSRSNAKFLVFSAHDQSFQGIEESLAKVNQKCVKLVGSGHRIKNIVNDYKTGNLNVLLLNANHYGTGLNLENTTDLVFYHKMTSDMESQVIGRAQRFGRSSPLNIHYLYQENEI